ncbi:hypothetical protein CDD81_202 [Ophiocordyceps australis]|uniref:Uncharacterized protein n=1 Tax=Ophiocordyceps australis TaxID=1399860 RepID=A0A2C5XBH3_9HYPO|nr:hypothetical protein CDD81_202 [Ophiocordyceps australis]
MEPTQIRAQASHWEHTPIQQPAKASWDADIAPSSVPSLLGGFIPEQMEDKWFIYAQDVDAQGNVLVHFCRSWTGAEVLVLGVRVGLDDEGGVDQGAAAKVVEITWEDGGSADGGEEAAKNMAVRLCKGILECDIVVPE